MTFRRKGDKGVGAFMSRDWIMHFLETFFDHRCMAQLAGLFPSRTWRFPNMRNEGDPCAVPIGRILV